MKIHLRMTGCRLNQAEIETMIRQFHRLGHKVVDDPAEADEIVVNTCAVTLDANRASRRLVRQLGRANEAAPITVTGCYAQIAPDEIAILPGVKRIIPNGEKEALVQQVTGQAADETFDLEPLERDLPGRYGRTRAFVKVQDGCDNACTFCITTVARGVGRSRPVEVVVREVRMLVEMGYSEVVLTGVHLGSYGHDFGDPDGLARLVRGILSETSLPRLRLSSLEPWDLREDFFALWQDSRLCRHLHLPLQSGCDATLRRMARRTTQQAFFSLVAAARRQIDSLAITTDIIVGFPGETDAEFAESARFVESMRFAGLHVFRYSCRPGTPAARMRGQIDEPTRKSRSEQMHALAERSAREYAASVIGRAHNVLWEQVAGVTQDGFMNVGYTDSYVRVQCTHPRALTGLITPAQALAYDPQRGALDVRPLLM
ncbi:MAG: tRNA (N(6)-L-threonylcarbamoyladenosine(37)-C(2))-methylthiotransferase MtaB [Anaerolineae bacterium]|nr:tRNA (N(6)-L-threonylcarbamoyladenosine(37)-C(2))-methylthiotransferase MtaB [Anaerolineae bacterium]NUQ03585.1 tRNA (N(6)-L-threonylcarbamoyladenosine(37)-C(2))-methylthiotransferase MtaB [Anaerolineae bacterium]